MRQTVSALAFIVLLPGCATAPLGPAPQDYTNAVGDAFVGRPVTAMTARYGAPLRQQEVAGETVYTWERTRSATYSGVTESYRCQLDAYVRPDGVVRTIGFSGQLGGCDPFMP